MEIRHSTEQDFERIMELYEQARFFMAEHGNPNQWGSTQWPPAQLIHDDILHNTNYVCVHENIIVGTFFFLAGNDIEPTYQNIENGKWIGNNSYGVVHRLAGDGSVKGIGKFCLDWAYRQCGHLRVDTHSDNVIIQNLLMKMNFLYCGIIYVTADNSPRLAYEKL